MATNQDVLPNTGKTMLVVPLSEAQEQIIMQLKQCQEMLEAEIPDRTALLALEGKIRIWRTVTTQMLINMFTTNEFASQFSGNVAPTSWSDYKTFPEAIDLDKGFLVKDLTELESIRQSLKYIPTASAPRQQSASVVPGPRGRTPVGSPYGFDDNDKSIVAEHMKHKDVLYIVLGYQFKSEYYNSEELKRNIENMFATAANSYNNRQGRPVVKASFQTLAAGYGEHQFNEIARDIISSDIAVFETSDLNPNVMIELGVALTWGVRVFPIKLEGRPKPPSDISGQTWADYRDHGSKFVDPENDKKIVDMVDRVYRRKQSI